MKLLSIYNKVLNETSDVEYSNMTTQLMNDLESRYDVDLYIYYSKFAHVILLNKIVVNKTNRTKGVGTQVMNSICEFADTHKMRIALTPSSDFGGSKSRLIEFYKRFGFKKYSGFEFRESMVRLPQ